MSTEQITRNSRVQEQWDELMREGKHGHYETLFRVVNEEVARAVVELEIERDTLRHGKRLADQRIIDMEQRIAEMEKDAQNVTVELDAMNANFQGMLTDRNAWRDKARELEKDAARYQRLKARDFCIDKEITAANADATIDAHMNDA